MSGEEQKIRRETSKIPAVVETDVTSPTSPYIVLVAKRKCGCYDDGVVLWIPSGTLIHDDVIIWRSEFSNA